ncbi:MAG: cyclodeaminase/cyclohydrolase family protein [Planctomycetes bacterium]|nr:cyclodeaminase/cyclohydrolase family protein [Planctomycetota bacterium]
MTIAKLSVDEYLNSLAAKTPAPGGGAVAAITTASAAALALMALNYSLGKKALSEFSELHDEALAGLSKLKDEAIALGDADAKAFEQLSSLWGLAEDDPKRIAKWAKAVQGAIEVPKRVMDVGIEILNLLKRLNGAIVSNLRSDAAIAALLAETGVKSAAWNVRINLPLLKSENKATEYESQIQDILSQAANVCCEIEQACKV